MCGRFFMLPDEDLMTRLSCRYDRDTLNQMPRGDIFPTQTVPVLAPNRQQKPDWFLMTWGYDMGVGRRPLINARYETAASKPAFAPSTALRRCAAPFVCYFEWSSHRIRHSLRPTAEEKHYLAGLYRHESRRPAFTLLTQPAVGPLQSLHPRMPVILSESDALLWVRGELPLSRLPQASATELLVSPLQ